jgi:hypothetical protein
MEKKILVIVFALIFAAIMIAPVTAIGPMKSPVGKNKNIGARFPVGEPVSTSVWVFTGHGLFKEYYDNRASGVKYKLMRQNASICGIGGAVDGSDWDFTAVNTGGAFMMLVHADSRWVYFSYEGMINLLSNGFGMPFGMALSVASGHPDGAYYKADMIGSYK